MYRLEWLVLIPLHQKEKRKKKVGHRERWCWAPKQIGPSTTFSFRTSTRTPNVPLHVPTLFYSINTFILYPSKTPILITLSYSIFVHHWMWGGRLIHTSLSDGESSILCTTTNCGLLLSSVSRISSGDCASLACHFQLEWCFFLLLSLGQNTSPATSISSRYRSWRWWSFIFEIQTQQNGKIESIKKKCIIN